ncbi:MAG: hypothetical protein K8T20_02695 [Planctomycetes bacterium]|nr:hypothetical protein [Planctomycetota bacterium]
MKIIGALLFSDFKNRLLALALAIVTWVSVYRESTEQVTTTARIDLQRSADVEILSIEDESGAPCSSIEVVVNGPRGERAQLRDLKLSRVINVPPAGETPFTAAVDVTDEVLNLPQKFRLVSAKPAHIRVKVDIRERRLLRPVAARESRPGEVEGAGLVEGKPAEGVRIVAATVSPYLILVQGPKSVLSRHGSVVLVPVKIDGLPAGHHELAAEIVGSLDGVAVSMTGPLLVKVDLREEPQEAVFTAKINLVQGEDYSKEFLAESAVKEAEVRVRGPASAITELKARPELLIVVVDVAAMRPEECQPIDEKELIATRPLVAQFRGKFPGMEDVEISFRKPEKPETVVTFRRRPKVEPPK